MEYAFLLTGLAIGFILGKLLSRSKSDESNEEVTQLKSELNRIQGINQQLTEAKGELKGQLEQLQLRVGQMEGEQSKLLEDNQTLRAKATELSTQKEALEKLKLEQTNLQESFQKEFKAIANEVLKSNSNTWSDQHSKSLNDILKPLKERIKEFEQKVDRQHLHDAKQNESLNAELRKLMQLNQQLQSEATNLTKALTSDNKKQGNWGEVVLERVLERSGLQRDVEYKAQVNTTNQQDQTIQPDVVVYLPEDKHIIIDSKVSLVAYNNAVNAEEDEVRKKAIALHIQSVKQHIKGLSEKNYHTATGLNSPDFVLLFIPIESAFSLAIQSDTDLFNYAWEKKIVLVSPTTLLATLRTIASVWKAEKQNQNAIEIAKAAGNMYDKFVGFLGDMDNLKKRIDQVSDAYDGALNKLSTGKGDLIGRAEKIRKLGARANKSIDPKFLDEDND